VDKQMQDFFDKSLGKSPFEKNASVGEKVYQELVLHRFTEVISQAFPILSATASGEDLNEAIKAFVKIAPSTPYIWQVPQNFWEWEQEKKLLNLPYFDDLCWYEWTEIELMMEVFEPLHVNTFSWEIEWKVDASVRLRELSYRVFESEFKNKGQWFMLAWYDRDKAITCYQEIDQVLYLFMHYLQTMSFQESLYNVSIEADVSEQEMQTYLFDALNHLAHKGVLTPKEIL
jgi:hypothetical protein